MSRRFFPFTATIHIVPDLGTGYYTSLKDAIDAEGSDKMYLVHPGTYIENNPIIVPQRVLIQASGVTGQSIIVAGDPTQDLFVLPPWAALRQLLLIGTSTPGQIATRAIFHDGSGSTGYSELERCVIQNFDQAVTTTGDGTGNTGVLLLNQVMAQVTTSSATSGFYAYNGGQIISRGLAVVGAPLSGYTVGKALYSTGANTKMSVATSSIQFCNNATYVDDGGEMEVTLITTRSCRTAICIGPTGTSSKMRAVQFNIKNSVVYDIDIQATDAQIALVATDMNEAKVNNTYNVEMYAQICGFKNSKMYQAMIGDIRVGTVRNPSKLTIGQGMYDADNMYVLQNTNLESGSWTNITTSAKSLTGSVFDLFSGTSVDQCIYIGDAYGTNIVGIKVDVTTALADVISTDIALEYWNGSIWTTAKSMCTLATTPYDYQLAPWLSVIGKYNLRLNITSATTIPAKTLNSISAKWIRLRLLVNTWASMPQLESIQLHTSAARFNETGCSVLFGDARAIATLNWGLSNATTAILAPANQSLFLGKSLGVSRTLNLFQDGLTDTLGLCEFLPPDIDTSFPLKIKMVFFGSLGIAGNADFTVRWTTTKSNSAVYITTLTAPVTAVGEQTISQSLLITAANVEMRTEFEVNLEGVIPYNAQGQPDLLWLTIERAGATDTYSGDVAVTQFGFFYIKWRNGPEITSY